MVERAPTDEDASRPGPIFDASAPLATVLAWPDLPRVLRRALSRAVPRQTIETLSFAESVQAWTEPVLREWIVGLLALDVGVGIANSDKNENLIGVFADGRLGTAMITRFIVPPAYPGEGFGAAFRALAPDAPPTVSAAAYVYCDADHRLESSFLFIAGATDEPVMQMDVDGLRGKPFDEAHIERALAPIAGRVLREHADTARAVAREAVLECLAAMNGE